MFGQTNVEEKNGRPLVTPDMDGRFYQTVTAVPAIVLEDSPKSADVKRSKTRRILSDDFLEKLAGRTSTSRISFDPF